MRGEVNMQQIHTADTETLKQYVLVMMMSLHAYACKKKLMLH